MSDDKIDTWRRANKVRQHGDYAHLPGGGPPGMTCNSCAFLDGMARCEKVAELRQIKIIQVKPIWRHTKACKFYREREREPSAGQRIPDSEQPPY